MSTKYKKTQSTLSAVFLSMTLDPNATKPLHAQLADALRAVILSKNNLSGARIPASRALAEELSVSRMTVTTAFDQLLSEGYLVARKGSGTFIADHIPHLAPPAPRIARAPAPSRPWLPFQPGLPDQSLFPHRLWARHLERAWRAPSAELLTKPDPFGWHPLRAAICEHLGAWRGLKCDAEQIIVTGGAWDAFDIICRAVFEPGQNAVIEDPGWSLLRLVLSNSGITPTPVRIGGEGLDASEFPDGVAAAIVTPSRHYPTGISMPLALRLALLDWASDNQALVIEDDYDSEFRYQGQPLPSLSGLDGLRHTIYLGSFSKLLSPAMRIGYMVVPTALIAAIKSYLSLIGSRASLTPQPALANFMDSGEFATHLRRMRRTYAKRQARLIRELGTAPDILVVRPDPSGMHLCCPLNSERPHRFSDTDIAAVGDANGLALRALSSHSVLRDPPQGLLLGYAAFDDNTLARAAQTLSDTLRRFIDR